MVWLSLAHRCLKYDQVVWTIIWLREAKLGASFARAYLLVDWHNAREYVAPTFGKDPRRELPDILLRIQQQAAAVLSSFDAARRFRVTMRIYHGWHNGRDPMPIRRDFEQFENDVELARTFSKVSFAKGFEFGNEPLYFDSSHPIYATKRPQGQKMVDTSIVCDLLEVLRTDTAQIVIVLSDDDDFIPAALMAYSWKKNGLLLRRPGSGIKDVTDIDEKSFVRYWS